MSELLGNREDVKRKLKDILRRLSQGEDVIELKKEFKGLLKS
ncbi:MAG TPA: DUF438 domain-containing protein, partial [Thermoplasmatales archaeon]|nr:DUF438 domain-containing protein [Thermoplasmatales archaeon]